MAKRIPVAKALRLIGDDPQTLTDLIRLIDLVLAKRRARRKKAG